ncbi:hypothetical protein M2150_000929 [Lachnospiraceae bacterium PM6-15]|uniref:nucleotidyl transferase AbiEii/AbiGii toxin family protein n=1 Tax=Ohessyouella blattaphilus TaxID=2949333 RepID=UPI003E1819F6
METLLAEKLETVMTRSIANTRMRDFYDIYVISLYQTVDYEVLSKAFSNTSEKRGSIGTVPQFMEIIDAVGNNKAMQKEWDNYKSDTFFVGELNWGDVIKQVKRVIEELQLY